MILPHEEAAALIESKPIVTREVFDAMLPELRGRAFTITGIQSADVMQRVRDGIAALPRGAVWEDAKHDIAQEMEPFLGEEGSVNRATLLLRTHGFQAFQASTWRVAQEDADTTHLQYLATEDSHVRDTHLALNGITLPKDDPFWGKHFPPWEWGCRCRARPMNPDLVDETRQEDEQRPPDGKLVLEGPSRRKLEEGTLIRDGQTYNVSAPSDGPDGDKAFAWHPDDLRLPVGDLKLRYDPEVWDAFEANAKTTLLEKDLTLWNWLLSKPAKLARGEMARQTRRTIRAIAQRKGEPAMAAPVQAPPKPEPPTQQQLEAARALAAGWSKAATNFLAKLPDSLKPDLSSIKFGAVSKVEAHYNSALKKATIDPDPATWSGHPSTASHEFGHHIHFERRIVTAAHVDAEFEKAIGEDAKVFARRMEEARGPGWKGQISAARPGTRYAIQADIEKLYGAGPYFAQPLEMQKKIVQFADAVLGATRAKFGYGHPLAYMKTDNHSPMEVFANAFSAIIDDDKVFQAAFPNTVAFLRKTLNL